MKQPRAWLTASGVFALFLLLAWAVGPLLGLTGRDLWILRGGMALLGLAGAVLAGMYVARRAKRAPPVDAAGDEVGEVLEAAQARLAASALAGSSRVSALPVVLVLGPAGSAKTSAVVHSGVDPELLAGEVERAGAVAPTGLLNAWYGRDTLFLEAGGALLDDEGRWQSLVRHLQPGRWGAVVGRGTQAPRAAVVCFACDELLSPGAADAVPAAARKLRGRLADLSRQLGVRLPVYVLFTRADRIPHFAEYVRGLTQEEAQEVLGATFPMADPQAAGLYPEFAAARAGDALRTLARSLSVGQLHLLPREPREEARGSAYEFPRKLRKLSELATQFMVELCRPSQLHVSPFLRGFYFTGVRTVVAAEGMETASSAPAAGPHVALGATSVFDPRRLREAAAAPPPRGGTREVQEWAFARRIFSDVVLRDRVAMAATGGGTRVNALRRTLAAAAVVVSLVAATGFTVSYGGNRGMLSGAVHAAREAREARVDPAELAGADALRRLDGLRGSAQTIAGYERSGRPLRLRWGLYTGGRAFPSLRRLYFQGFDRQLWTRTRGSLVGALRSLPEAPTGASEYGTTYDDLKAYLVTTQEPGRSTGEFLAPVLERHWAPEGQADRERRELARRQFAFFGSELPHGNPFDPAVDEPLVVYTRAFLGRFAQVERFYNAMLVEAAKGARDVDFGREFPLAAPVAADPYVVPAAFTARGWGYVRGNARAVERLFAREDWVLGPHSVGAADRERIGRELHDRYVQEYVRHWRRYLEAGRVVPFGGLDDAALKLGPLSGNDSPVLQLLSLASQHTNVDSVLVGSVFQPVHLVVPPALHDRVAAEGTAAYLVALGGVRGALQQAAATPPELRAQPLSQAGTAVTQADGEVRKLAQAFRIDGDAGAVGAAVQRLLRAPVIGAEGVVNPALASLPKPGEAEAAAAAAAAAAPKGPGPNAAGAHFCDAFRQLGGRYPFDAGAAREAEPAAVAAVLQREESALAELREAVGGLVSRQGRGYVAKLGADPRPRGEFLGFFTTASDVSGALYGEEGGGPRVSFTLRPRTSAEVPEVSVTVDGRTRQFTRTLANSEAFTWHATDGGDARLVAQVGGAEVVVATGEGTWAAFRLFRGASWQPAGDGRWLAAWRVPGLASPLVVEVRFADDVPVFNPAYLGRLTPCVQRIVP
jgi:type VI secretion system protein ImpL